VKTGFRQFQKLTPKPPRPSGTLPKLMRCLLAHRDISLRCEIRSLSGHCGHGRACGWLDLCREWPNAGM